MKACEAVMQEILESNPNMGALEVAMELREKEKELARSVQNAKRKGYYANKDKRELFVIDKASKLVGTTIPMESMEGNTFVDVPVKKAEMIAHDVVSINDGEYVLDLATKMTRDGQYILGSEDGFSGDFVKMKEVNGTVLNDIDEYARITKDLDKEALSPEHKAHLEMIIEGYKAALQEAGKDVDITVEMLKDLNEANNTRGEADPEVGKIKMFLGNLNNNTMTEILAHELQHVLLRNVIGKNSQLAHNINKLRDMVKHELDKKYEGEGWKMFTEGKENADPADAKKKWDYVFNNTKYPADEFLAYATTNEQMVKALGQIYTLEKMQIVGKFDIKEGEKARFKKAWNRIADLINKLYRDKVTKGDSAADLALNLLDVGLSQSYKLQESNRKGRLDKILEGINKLDKTAAKYTGQIEKEYDNFEEQLKKEDGNKIVEAIWKIRGLAKLRSKMLQNNLFNSVTKDLKNPDIAKFYEMFRKSKAFVDKEVVAVKDKTATLLESDEGYGLGRLGKEVKKSVKRLLVDADLKSLGKMEDIKKYLEDESVLDKELEEIASRLDSNVKNAAEDLAELLVTNKARSRNGYLNANQIALKEAGTNRAEVIADIDKYTTLAALKLSSDHNKANLLKAIEENAEGLDKSMQLLKTDEDRILKEAYFGDKMYQVKGAKQEYYNGSKRHYLVEEKEMKELVKAGMVNLGRHEELSRVMENDVYMVVGESTDTAYTEGLMSVIQLKNEGDSLKHILMEMGQMTEDEIDSRIAALAEERGNALNGEALIPERSGNGGIYDYKIRVPYEAKKDYLDLDDDIVTTVASTVSNLTHKQEAMLNNKQSLIYLRKFYKDYKANPKYKFIEISEKSTGTEKEYWDLLPHYMKRDIKKNNNGKLMIEESLLVDYFGYQDVSLVNAPWIKNRKKRQIVAKKTEQAIQEVTRAWKKMIVAFTPGTIIGNTGSNMLVAMQHTSYKNPVTYLENFKNVWGMMNDYHDDRSKKIELELRRDAGEKISQKEIDGLEAKMRSNPVSDIIEDGQYTAILEDINTEFFNNQGMFEKKIEDALGKIKKDKSRENVKKIFDTIYLRKGNKLHDSVMKMTTYADAVNKMIVIMDYKDQVAKMKEAGKSEVEIAQNFGMEKTSPAEIKKYLKEGTTPQSWLNHVDKMHVNYSYLDNRYVKYANDLGFLTFTKYFFRIMPAMVKLLANKTFTVMTTEAIRKGVGIGETPFEPFYDISGSLMNKISLWGRPLDVFGDILAPRVIP